MKPLTRLEHFLAKIAGDKNAKALTPKTRKEYYLNEIAAAAATDAAKEGLPEVAVKDAGKVLIVSNEGKWTVGSVPAPAESTPSG